VTAVPVILIPKPFTGQVNSFEQLLQEMVLVEGVGHQPVAWASEVRNKAAAAKAPPLMELRIEFISTPFFGLTLD
jgi:hypothetical protein